MATRVAARIWRLESDYPDVCGFPLWTYAVEGSDSVCLLDAGVATTFDAATRRELAEAGFASADLGLLVVSHAHPDHLGGAAEIVAAAPGCEVAGPAREIEWLEDREVLLKELWGAYPGAVTLTSEDERAIRGLLGSPVRMDHLLRHGDVLPGGHEDLEVIVTSGHSPGHLALLDRRDRVLFTFDDVQGSGTHWLHKAEKLAPLYHDVDRYRAGLTSLLALDFDCLAPSHGEVLDADRGRRLIELSLQFVEDVQGLAASVLRRGPTTVGALAEAIDQRFGPFGGVGLQTAAIARAHLDHLVASREADVQYLAIGGSGG